MILSITIIILLLLGFYAGYRRGVLCEAVYLGGYALSFWAAIYFYRPLANKLSLWVPYPTPQLDSPLYFYSKNLLLTLDRSFYAALAFMLILFIGWLIVRFIGALCYKLTFVGSHFQFVRIASGLLGGVVHTIIIYIGTTLFLVLASFLPLSDVQEALDLSPIASSMIEESPILSQKLYNLWVEDVQK